MEEKSKFIGVRLAPSVYSQLDTRSKRLGIPKATLASFIIGNFLYQQDYVVTPAIQTMCESIKDAMITEMKGMEEVIYKHANEMMDDFEKMKIETGPSNSR